MAQNWYGLASLPRTNGNQANGWRMATRKPTKVLFIGNSFTARNNLPGLIGQMAASLGKKFKYQLISAGGASLRAHWNAGEARKAIKEGRFECVVL